MRQYYPKETLQKILDQYQGLGTVREHYLFTSGYENSNFFIETDSGKFVIKIFEGLGVTPVNILFELEMMDESHRRGIKTPRVFRNKNNSLASIINGKQAIVMNFFDGENMHKKSLSDDLVKETAQEAAKMDTALKNFRDGSKTRQDYEFDIKHSLLLEKSLKLLPPAFDQKLFGTILHDFRKVKPAFDRLPAGIIHNDIVPHNLLVKNGKLQAVIDFSDMVFSPYIQNLAVSLHLMVFGYNWQPQQAKIFIDAYRKYHPLSQAELEVLYELILARFSCFIVEFNRWNVEFGEDQQRTDTINDQYQFLGRFLKLGKPGLTKALASS